MKKMTNMKFKIGDSVKVKKGIKEPDFDDLCIEDWQGRVLFIENEDDEILVQIEWDSITLNNLPEWYIENSEEEGYEWHSMYLYADDIELTNPRDSEEETEEVLNRLENKYYIKSLGETGVRIQNVLGDLDYEDGMKALEKWRSYLQKHIQFPFDAIATIEEEYDDENEDTHKEYEDDNFSEQEGKVLKIKSIHKEGGIIVEFSFDGNVYDVELFTLTPNDKNESTNQLINDYCEWFERY